MAVRIVLERTVSVDNQAEVMELLKELRVQAVRQPGYVSEETLFSMEEPGAHLVISTWQTLGDWKAWVERPQRKEILERIESLLTAQPRVAESRGKDITSTTFGTLSRKARVVCLGGGKGIQRRGSPCQLRG